MTDDTVIAARLARIADELDELQDLADPETLSRLADEHLGLFGLSAEAHAMADMLGRDA